MLVKRNLHYYTQNNNKTGMILCCESAEKIVQNETEKLPVYGVLVLPRVESMDPC